MKNVLLTLPLLALFATFSSAEEIITKVNATTKSFWSYKPLRRPSVPKIGNPAWSANPIDAFIYSRLKKNSLQPAPRADKRALARRAFFDLLGLPPTREQLSSFISDDSPGAWEKLIDSLLESKHYGERWARY
ncbi:MAG TPA: hypothetical protein DCS85_02175, partial [Verrucomicrobiales bacterium]|nr:hypothetical protein [Verrucomicrobiales bacterium]